MRPTRSFAAVVMMQKVRTHSPVAGFFQFSQRPARPNGDRSCMSMAYGCFTFEPLIVIHSKKPSIGTMQRRLRYASRNIGSRSTVSALALIGGGFGLSLHQYGMSPQPADRPREPWREPVNGP